MFLSQRTPITACEPKIVAYFKFLMTTPLCLGGINLYINYFPKIISETSLGDSKKEKWPVSFIV